MSKITSKQDEGNIEMSSPGVAKGTRLDPPCPEDYHTAVVDMETNDLFKSNGSKKVQRFNPYPEYIE